MRDYRARPTLLPSTRSSSLIDQFSYELWGKFKEAWQFRSGCAGYPIRAWASYEQNGGRRPGVTAEYDRLPLIVT